MLRPRRHGPERGDDVGPERDRVVVAWIEREPRRPWAAGWSDASHSASSVDLPKPAGPRRASASGARAAIQLAVELRPRHEAISLSRRIELGVEQRAGHTQRYRVLRLRGDASRGKRLTGNSCDPLNAALARRLRRPSRPRQDRVSPFTRARTWSPISASISGSHSQLRDVMASSNIGRNSRATASWIPHSTRRSASRTEDPRRRTRRPPAGSHIRGTHTRCRGWQPPLPATRNRPRTGSSAQLDAPSTRGSAATCRSKGTVGVAARNGSHKPRAVAGHGRLPLQEQELHRRVVRRTGPVEQDARGPRGRRWSGRPRSIRGCRSRPRP